MVRGKKLRGFSAVIIVMLITVLMAVPASAASGINVQINTEEGTKNVPFSTDLGYPFIDAHSRTLCPLRAVADAMGLSVKWNDASKTATFTYDEKVLVRNLVTSEIVVDLNFTLNQRIYDSDASVYVDGELKEQQHDDGYMDTMPVNVGGRVYAPVRYLAAAYGYDVDWNDSTKTVILTGTKNLLKNQLIEDGYGADEVVNI